jgi:putative transcriptional regulator
MTTFGKDLLESAGEALAIAEGRLQPAKIITPEVIDVAAIRKRLNLSQEK